MYSLFNSENPAAPVYEPHKWNEGQGPAELKSAIQGFFQAARFDNHAPISISGYVQIFDRMNRADIGLEPAALDPEVVENLTYVPYEAIKILHDQIKPMLGTRLFKNCYAYGTDDHSVLSGHVRSCAPGAKGGKNLFLQPLKGIPFADFCHAVIDSCEADGHEYIGLEPRRLKDHYLMALYLGENTDTGKRDFHFVREDRDGLFSNKSGMNTVSRVDQSGKPLVDPADATFLAGPYQYKFEGYFLSPGST